MIDTNKAIKKGIEFLAKEQQGDGSFLCLVSTKLDDYSNAKKVPAIVPTNIVLSSLIHISETAAAKKIKQKAADFLLTQKSYYWSFNYWFRNSKEYREKPYPDDLDDTFCALAALYEYNPDLLDGEVMAKIIIMLTSAEKEEGGPYNMWLVPPEGRKVWNNTDLVVNSNIAFFLSFQDITLPKVIAFIEKSIKDNGYEFPYNGIYPAIYFISRFYYGDKIEKMAHLLLKKQESDGKWENSLRTALAVSALINFSGAKHLKQIEKGVQYLIKSQGKNGGWQPYSFYVALKTKDKTFYDGSPVITAALCLEAINKYQEIGKSVNQEIKKSVNQEIKQQNKIYNQVIKMAKQRFSMLDSGLEEQAIKMLKKTLKNDKDRQIVLLPYFFLKSLKAEKQKALLAIDHGLPVILGLANLCGWMAYTIYDDFLDEEGDPKLLPIANVCLRELSVIFNEVLPKETGFADFSKKILDKIDSANAWEVSNCRLDSNKLKVESCPPMRASKLPNYGDYSKLAERSLGHALGPVAILFALGFKENSTEIKNLMKFLKHYLIARQLNDDTHDWEEDLKKGHINAVGARIMETRNQAFSYAQAGENEKTDETLELQQILWYNVVVGICDEILRHIEFARKTLREIATLENCTPLEKFFAPIEKSAKKALEERKESIKFLKAYDIHKL